MSLQNMFSNDKEGSSFSNLSSNNFKSKISTESIEQKCIKWSPEEDSRLLEAAQKYTTKNWELISQLFPGKSSKQCSSRYKKINIVDLVKGPWTYEEDRKLLKWIQKEGPKRWSMCAETIVGRTGKQCRERWFNALNPEVKKGEWTVEEDYKIYLLYSLYGGRWSKISLNFPNRTENSIKNRFYSSLRKLYAEKAKYAQANIVKKDDSKTSIGIGELIKLFPIAFDGMTNKLIKSKNFTLPQFNEYKTNLINSSNVLSNTKKKYSKKSIKFELQNETLIPTSSYNQSQEEIANKEISEEKEDTISESNSEENIIDLDKDNSLSGYQIYNEDLESFDFDKKINNSILQACQDAKKLNGNINCQEGQSAFNNTINFSINNVPNQIANYTNSSIVNINCNFYLQPKEDKAQKTTSKENCSSHKVDIYSYLLEELEDLETFIKKAKSEILNYNSRMDN